MNTNLLLCLGCLQQAMEFSLKAEKDIYLDDALRESEDCIYMVDALILAIDVAIKGCVDDIALDDRQLNHKPTVTYVDFKGGGKNDHMA